MTLDDAVFELDVYRTSMRAAQKKTSPGNFVEIGDFTAGTPLYIFFDEKTKLRIGKFCTIGGGVQIVLGYEHPIRFISTFAFNYSLPSFAGTEGCPGTKGDINIGNDVWLASDCKILSGVSIGDGAVIGASALIAKDVPPYAIVGGNPQRIIRYRFAPQVIEKLLEIKWWDFEDKHLCSVIPFLQSEDTNALFDYWERNVK
ncbi:MAG: CatB-related O-acetyltransferase [Termitinemataceae bacterium]|nr:MAG: CatB-related O-acetyltransferase [Termitinemataceae bacterium]